MAVFHDFIQLTFCNAQRTYSALNDNLAWSYGEHRKRVAQFPSHGMYNMCLRMHARLFCACVVLREPTLCWAPESGHMIMRIPLVRNSLLAVKQHLLVWHDGVLEKILDTERSHLHKKYELVES